MNQRTPIFLFVLTIFSLNNYANTPDLMFSALAGKWVGSVESNIREVSDGGTPSEGEVGTPVTIHFTEVPEGLEGQSRLGQETETWEIKNNFYRWSDQNIEVVTKRIEFKDLPKWVVSELKLTSKDQLFAFKYDDCTVKATKKKCVFGKDLPKGIQKSAHWVFKVEANQLKSHVIYKHSGDKKRILIESLKKE